MNAAKITIKVYLPKSLFNSKRETKLYGQFVVQDAAKVFYIIAEEPGRLQYNYIGNVTASNDECSNWPDNFLNFQILDNTLVIKNIKIDNELNFALKRVHLILYCKHEFNRFINSEDIDGKLVDNFENDEIMYLAKIFNDSDKENQRLDNEADGIAGNIKAVTGMITVPLKYIFKNTAVSHHFADWWQCLTDRKPRRRNFCTLLLDVFAGLTVLYCIRLLTNPGDYLMRITMEIVKQLRSLLNNLDGNPVGLKLNSQLNQFLLECFKYHVDLWATFLAIISPAINYLFIPLGVLGVFGLSFQIAMLSDLVVVITLHAYCFYIYAAILYQIELFGITALWRVMLGRRKNILKHRIESYNFNNGQLYLSTMFFAAFLFLLPTVCIYYIVFASLRFIVYCITYTLSRIRQKILLLPVYSYYLWLTRNYVTIDNIELKILDPQQKDTGNFNCAVCVVAIQLKSSPPWNAIPNVSETKILANDRNNNLLSIKEFLILLIKGEMFGFVTPKNNKTNKIIYH